MSAATEVKSAEAEQAKPIVKKPVVKKSTKKASKPVVKKSTKKASKPVAKKASKPVAKKASKPVVKKEPKAQGIGNYARELLAVEPDVEKVHAEILRKFPGAKTSKASIYWYRSQMNSAV